MSLELDTRDYSFKRAPVLADRRTGTRTDAAAAPVTTELDAFTGTPGTVAYRYAGGSMTTRALVEVRRLASAFVQEGEDPPDFVAGARVHRTSSGAAVVHLYQQHCGVPVFEAVRTVLFDPLGRLLKVSGSHVPVSRDVDLEATLAPSEAVMRAARYLAESLELKVSRHRPRVVAAFPLPGEPCVLKKRPFVGLITAQLTLFYRGRDMRLGWLVALQPPRPLGAYQLIVAANGDDSGEALYCRCTAATVVARGRVFTESPGEGHRQLVDFPPPPGTYPPLQPAGLPSAFPRDWVKRDRTKGNNVDARGRGRTVRGRRSGGVLVFDPADARGRDQRVLNAFYTCNYLHDLFYLLGFDESERNFQRDNFSAGGRGGDELDVRVHGTAFPGNASMDPNVDGRSCRLSLGPVSASGRHTALDPDVVAHEFVHGVTARLVGGEHLWRPLLGGPQAASLDEGYCDYFAVSIRLYNRLRRLQSQGATPAQLESEASRAVFGEWSADNAQHGLRRHAYGDGFPGTFGDLGASGFSEAHDAGQIWAEALLRLSRRLGGALGDAARGHLLGWQLVVDSLKQLSGGGHAVGFLQARDRLLDALDLMAHGLPLLASGEPLLPPDRLAGARRAALTAFAELGMGPQASSDGVSLTGIQADFTPPAS